MDDAAHPRQLLFLESLKMILSRDERESPLALAQGRTVSSSVGDILGARNQPRMIDT
jgi:hypothetical protein